MLRFETELRELHAAGTLDSAATERALALDRGEVYSLHAELRLCLYAAVALITIGVGVLLKQNLQHIGPLTLLAAIGLAAGACYATALRTRRRGSVRSLAGDYLLLLGALLLSSGCGYAESQFHLFGEHWARQLLLLALVHASTAYYFDSRLLLSLALTSLASWLGIEPGLGTAWSLPHAPPDFGWRALACAALIFAWREIDRRARLAPQFLEVFDHFALILALGAGLLWCVHPEQRLAGLLLLVVLGAFAVYRGYHRSSEFMVVYGVVYPAIGLGAVCAQLIGSPLVVAVIELMLAIGALLLLWRLRAGARAGP
ncbi:MAG TPA: DUF2157 domain-containing protein [Burkholderiaceae bacterium]|nr:DUF2157 domain-containing protein [Burkholderiaceae bacterium]